MYTNLKNINILISVLKNNNISHVVISPGNSHNAIVRCFEEDCFFTTYNIVDERSAAFFACGLSQEKKCPIALCCTSGTATSNYLTGVTEASRRGMPLVIITGDKNPYYLGQYEDQMIDQSSIFKTVTKYQCTLPMTESDKDLWYSTRVLNEAMLEMNHHGLGPVHINVPIEKGMRGIGEDFTIQELPKVNQIHRYDWRTDKETFKSIFEEIGDKKILVLCGQDDHISEEEDQLVESISQKYNIVFAVDKISNLHGTGTVEISRAVKRNGMRIATLFPDIVISIAGNTTLDIKFQLKGSFKGNHWIVNENGRVADPFKKLNKIFEMETLEFLRRMNSYSACTSNTYLKKWEYEVSCVEIPDFKYSNLYSVQKVMNGMIPNSNFNIANSTTIRIAQYFELAPSIQVYCNRGVNGIDGCVSTFIGQAAASPDKLNYLIVGDLTFFYDMNSIWNRYIGKNVRIMLNNNEGASLFHFNQGGGLYPSLNKNVAAEHFATAKGWVESQGFSYLCAHNKEEFDEQLPLFLSNNSDRPIFFEVFTHKEDDAAELHRFYDAITYIDASTSVKSGAKRFLKSVLSDDIIQKLKNKI